jgi:hypothetical protein
MYMYIIFLVPYKNKTKNIYHYINFNAHHHIAAFFPDGSTVG